MIKFTHKGNFKNTEKFLKKAYGRDYYSVLEQYAKQGVAALAANTPVDSGVTAGSWGYEIHISKGSVKIHWTNDSFEDGVPIAILLQYGHATRNGGYVQGRDYINPAIQPIFDKMAEELWREVTA